MSLVGEGFYSIFLGGDTFHKIYNFIELFCRGINMRRMIYKCVSCHELLLKLYSYNITLVDYMDFSCHVGSSQKSCILAKLFHCKPFHHF